MPSSCQFEFDHPTPVYYSGETINGRVILITESNKNVNDVTIRFEGEGKVRWEESRTRTVNGKTETYTEYFRGDETYINNRTLVHSAGTLPPGRYEWTFSIVLPFECPTSCVGVHGQITYELSLVVNRSFRFDNVFKKPITIIKQLNLNNHPELTCPIKGEEVKYFCCWPCSSGPVIATLTLPFGGYAPGQDIKYTIEVDNQSIGNDLQFMKLKLVRIFAFTATSPHHKTRHEEDTIVKANHSDRCLRLSKKRIEGALAIPSIPPTFSTNIIGISYALKLTVETGSCHNDIDLHTPITIGTVPLIQSAQNPEHRPSAPMIPPTPDTPDGDQPPSYDLMKPPSFEEAMISGNRFVDTDVDERNRCDGFMPKYPMYNNFAMPTAPQGDLSDLSFINPPSTQTAPSETAHMLGVGGSGTDSQATANYGWAT